MFERLQKPFLTVETGEAYQPIRLTYDLLKETALISKLNELKCLEKNPSTMSWNWFWRDECADLNFESIDTFKKPENPIRLGTLTIRDKQLYINLSSFKRACLAVPFFYKLIDINIARASKADFINKVFGVDERLPHGFSELFKEEELEKIVRERLEDYDKIQEQVEDASSVEEALTIVSGYTQSESQKKLPYAERYQFKYEDELSTDPDVIFLGFYIFLRGRELVAIKRWFGETGYTLADAAEDTVEQVFGGMNIDIIE